jgi:ABC-2 type transport system ATP-binding protein
VQLQDNAKLPVRTLSGGMKQRLMVARALLHDPAVLFLDEPTRGLDPIAAREVRLAIRQLSQQGKTILLTTHLLEEADQLSDRVAFMVSGNIVANDTPLNLKLSHGQRTLELTLSDTRHPGQLIERSLNMDDPKDQRILEELMSEGNVRAIHSQEASLEDVFIEVAGMRPA